MLEENRMARNPLRRSGFNCSYTFGRGTKFEMRPISDGTFTWFSTFTCLRHVTLQAVDCHAAKLFMRTLHADP